MTHSVDNLAGCVERKRSRETGTLTEVFIAAEQGIDVGDCKYAVVCRDHGTLLGVDNLRDARYYRAHPTGFCEECRDAENLTGEKVAD